MIKIGPMTIGPRLAISGVGIDTNVFNTIDDPKQDFTATISPQAEVLLRLGHARVRAKAQADYDYFRTFTSQGGLSTNDDVTIELPLNRVVPYVSESFTNSRQRPGFEIDARARRVEDRTAIGANVRLTGRAFLTFEASRGHSRFDGDAFFDGIRLREALSRDEDALSISLHKSLTPLTSFVVIGEAKSDRFLFNSLRDADTVKVTSGVELSQFALIKGHAYAGYRKYDALGAGIPSFTGLVFSAKLGYTLLGRTQFAVELDRDVQFSYDPRSPYYLQTSIQGTVTEHVVGRWDVQARAQRQSLAYRVASGVLDVPSGRVDYVYMYGGGTGYRLARGARFGINADYYRRRSPIDHRQFTALKAGTSLTYGF